MTFPKQVKETLILIASSNDSPTAPLFDTFSQPAKSIKFNFPLFSEPLGSFYEISTIKTVWERELYSLRRVALVYLEL